MPRAGVEAEQPGGSGVLRRLLVSWVWRESPGIQSAPEAKDGSVSSIQPPRPQYLPLGIKCFPEPRLPQIRDAVRNFMMTVTCLHRGCAALTLEGLGILAPLLPE